MVHLTGLRKCNLLQTDLKRSFNLRLFTVKEAHAVYPLVPLTRRETLMQQKTTQMALNGKASLMKASYISGADGFVQQHMHRTFMYLGHALSLRLYFIIIFYSMFVTLNFLLEPRVGGWGEGSAWASFTVNTPRFSRRFQIHSLENCGIYKKRR